MKFMKQLRRQGRLFGLVLQIMPPPGSVDVQPVWTPWIQVAASIEVSLSNDVRVAEEFDRLGRIDVQEDVVVPGRFVRMEKEHHVGHRVVMVDDVGQVYHCFVALIGRQPGHIAVDGVDFGREVGKIPRYPAYIFSVKAAHDQDPGIVVPSWSGYSRSEKGWVVEGRRIILAVNIFGFRR